MTIRHVAIIFFAITVSACASSIKVDDQYRAQYEMKCMQQCLCASSYEYLAHPMTEIYNTQIQWDACERKCSLNRREP